MSSSYAVDYDGKPQPKLATEPAKELEGIGISEKIGQKLNLSQTFIDEEGQTVPLSKYFDGKNPVILSPVYYSCPGLCNYHLNGLVEGLKGLDWSPGVKFQVIALSFDETETPAVAKAKKENYIKAYGRVGTENGWHFLTGTKEQITAITDAVGFKFKWNEEAKEWAHASAAIVITPDGTISRYLPGVYFIPQDIRLALNEASEGKLGTFLDRMVLYCFRYDPHASKYTLYAFNLMKLGGIIMMLILAAWLIPFWFRSRREPKYKGV